MNATLPALTPPEIIKWVESVEAFYPVVVLRGLPDDATLKQIEDAFYSEQFTLIGIADELMGAAKADAWSDYSNRIKA